MFLYPPRPENAISPDLLPYYEAKGYWLQLKLNGTCSVADVSVDGEVKFWKRDGSEHLAWKPSEEITSCFSKYPDSVFAFELLHSKGGGIKDTAYIFDVMRYSGKILVGEDLATRMVLLRNIKIKPSEKIWLVENRLTGFRSIFDNELVEPLEEGVVLKNPNAVLKSCAREGYNSSWQIKCRKPTPNLGF